MKIAVCLYNSNNGRYTRWVTLPENSYRLGQIIEQLCPNVDDDCVIVDYKTQFYPEDLTRYDIYYLNELVSNLNSYATDKEIQALLESYSTNLEDIQQKVQRGGYKFYANKTLMDVAEEMAETEQYSNYCRLDGEIEYDKIVDDLCKLGYEQTSTGVIHIYGY